MNRERYILPGDYVELSKVEWLKNMQGYDIEYTSILFPAKTWPIVRGLHRIMALYVGKIKDKPLYMIRGQLFTCSKRAFHDHVPIDHHDLSVTKRS